MNNRSLVLLMIMFLMAVSACRDTDTNGTGTSPPATMPPSSTPETTDTPSGEIELARTQWRLESFGPVDNPMPVLESSDLTLVFQAVGEAAGSGGCNTFAAGYTVEESVIEFGEIVSTLRACQNPHLTQQEQQYLAALAAAGQFEMTADTLTIHYDEGQGVLIFSATTEADLLTPSATTFHSLSGTSWQLESFGPLANETVIIEGSEIAIEFKSPVQVWGYGGCNFFSGDYQVEEDTISFGQIVSFEQVCEEAGVTEQEQAFFVALQTAESFIHTADQLTITYNNGRSVLNFVPEQSGS